MSRTIYIYLSSGTAPGPYSVYTGSVTIPNRIETGLSFAQLQAGRQYIIDDYSQVTFIISNDNPACGNTQTVIIPGVSPTPSATPSVTITPSVTPTIPGASPSVSITPSVTPTRTVARTPTPTPTPTITVTPSITVTPTITPTATPSTSGGSTAYRLLGIQLGNDAGSICSGGYTAVWISNSDYITYGSILSPGMTLYTNSTLFYRVTGFDYVRDDAYNFITYNLNNTTGVVGTSSGVPQC